MTLTLAPETEARLMAVATERNMAPEAVIDAAIDALFNPSQINHSEVSATTPEAALAADIAEQARLRAVMFELIAEAQALEHEPFDSPSRKAYRDKPTDDVIVEKFCRQGFNL